MTRLPAALTPKQLRDLAREVARVGLLERDDALIALQLLCELVLADIDGEDFLRAALEQNLGEAAGRRAHVEADLALGGDAEMVERMDEFQAAARDEGIGPRLQRQLHARVQHVAGAFDLPVAGKDIAGADFGLGAVAAAEKALLHGQQVGAHLRARRRPLGRGRLRGQRQRAPYARLLAHCVSRPSADMIAATMCGALRPASSY